MSDQSVTTFINEDVTHELFRTRLHCSNNRTITTIVKVYTYLISVDVSLLKSRITITTVRIDTIDARSARSACVHTAIVNVSALMDGEIPFAWQCVSNWSCFHSSHDHWHRHCFTLAERSCSTATNTAAPPPC